MRAMIDGIRHVSILVENLVTGKKQGNVRSSYRTFGTCSCVNVKLYHRKQIRVPKSHWKRLDLVYRQTDTSLYSL